MINMYKVEFYITNVCNLSCNGCNRFSNLKLRGHEDWENNRAIYKKFAEKVNVEASLNILGGEPLMHPKIVDILYDLRSFFPHQWIRIVTNGLFLDKVKNLRDAVIDNNIYLDVNVHNKNWRKDTYSKIQTLFEHKPKLHWKESQENFQKHGWADTEFSINNVKRGALAFSNYFYQNAFGHPFKMQLHDSDPAEAYAVCNSKTCHTITDGYLHKCPISATLPVVYRQKNNIEYTEKQRTLIENFPRIDLREIDTVSQEKLDALLFGKMDQCSVCPSKLKSHKLEQNINPNYFKNG